MEPPAPTGPSSSSPLLLLLLLLQALLSLLLKNKTTHMLLIEIVVEIDSNKFKGGWPMLKTLELGIDNKPSKLL